MQLIGNLSSVNSTVKLHTFDTIDWLVSNHPVCHGYFSSAISLPYEESLMMNRKMISDFFISSIFTESILRYTLVYLFDQTRVDGNNISHLLIKEQNSSSPDSLSSIDIIDSLRLLDH
jgi:hypothetical protein